MEKQDKAVRLVRDAIQSKLQDGGLPDLVASVVCSFALPMIRDPIENEMTW